MNFLSVLPTDILFIYLSLTFHSYLMVKIDLHTNRIYINRLTIISEQQEKFLPGTIITNRTIIRYNMLKMFCTNVFFFMITPFMIAKTSWCLST